MITPTLDISADDFASGTGWDIRPEGACKGEICVPLPGAEADWPFAGNFNSEASKTPAGDYYPKTM